ncbi:PREDICTED: stAR-related lipid transfer protein 3 [Ceratosolen solmsi marchali]|uniref:StAR-related lipid transfer protein 3 n=1 Tax=Ceratosolen solmsi marchali TaxID=326594 RepID=A0AAJ6VL18_9HYME|nr:PREDICTED: stAR-related lipid transfer protein 3 [Ceratosolen solmsi marchali]
MMYDYEEQTRLAGQDRQLRAAAESVLGTSINSQRDSYAQSVRTPDTVNDYFVGSLRYNNRTSNIRSFSIFVTFDFFFTVIMWLVCIVISGANVQAAFVQQIIHYHIKTSLFDIVVAAVLRFIILLLFYTICYMDHWCIVALSTSSTCAFLLSKVFLYDWSQSSQPVFQVLLILTSFVLVWGEVWFLDRTANSLQSYRRDYCTDHMNPERTPLLSPNYVIATAPIDNAGHFYTPMGSPDHSDNEDEVDQKRRVSNPSTLPYTLAMKPPQEMIEEFNKRAPSLLSKCHNLIVSENWKTDTVTSEGDIISYMTLPKLEKKIFKISGIVDFPAAKLLNYLYDNIESSTSWNKQVAESKKLYIINENTDLVYQATKTLGDGKISARDFVVLRHRGQYESYYVSSWVSVNWLPTRKNFIRGENGIGCFATQSLANGATEKSQFVWLLNTNLKGWLPQKLVNISMSKTLVEFINALRYHIRTIKD